MATEPTSTGNGQTNFPKRATAAAAAAPQDPWDSTAAVAQVLDRIQQGAGLPLGDAKAALAGRYTPAFQKQKDAGASFQVASETVLPLAQVVGSMATTLAVFKALLQNKQKLPPSIDAESALQAAELVAHLKFCPVKDPSNPTRGNFCPPKDPTASTVVAPLVQNFVGGLAALKA